MNSPVNKPRAAAEEISGGNEIGLREMTRTLVDTEKRHEVIREHGVDLSRGSDGPQVKLHIHGISAIEFLQKVEAVVPDIGERDALVGFALGNRGINRVLNETIERSTIEAPIGRSESEWGAIRDGALARGIEGFRDLVIVSAARFLVEPDRVAEPWRPTTYTRADKWIAELQRQEGDTVEESGSAQRDIFTRADKWIAELKRGEGKG